MKSERGPRSRRFSLPGAFAASLALAAAVGVWCLTSDAVVRPADAQMAPGAESRTLGLRWRFVRVQYSSHNTDSFRARYWSDPWAIDGPAAEQNLSRRVKSVTAIDVEDPVQIQIESPQLWDNPWIYFVEPGTLRFKEREVPIIREFLLRGGTAVLDDFHGPIEWDNVAREMARVF